MTTSAPTTVATGDIGDVSIVPYNGSLVSVCLDTVTGDVKLHFDGDLPTVFTVLPFSGAKNHLTASVIGSILHLAWANAGDILHARWNLLTSSSDKSPTVELFGSAPSLQSFSDGLVIHYVSTAGRHEWRVSTDGGDTWSSPPEIGVFDIVDDVDVNVSPFQQSQASFVGAVTGLFFASPPDSLHDETFDSGWEFIVVPPADWSSPDNSNNEDFESGWELIVIPTPDWSSPDNSNDEDFESGWDV